MPWLVEFLVLHQSLYVHKIQSSPVCNTVTPPRGCSSSKNWIDSVSDDDNDDDDAGSPFQFTVGPVRNGGAHKIVAIGQGLHSATVNQPGTLSALYVSTDIIPMF